MAAAPSIASEAVLKDADRLSSALMTAFLFSVAVIVLSVMAATDVSVPGLGVKLPTRHAWIALVGFTVVHCYLAVLFVKACRTAVATDREHLKETWRRLTETGPIFFRGLLQRLPPGPPPVVRFGFEVVPISRNDPTGWLDHAAVIALVVAAIPLGQGSLSQALATFILPLANWTIGTYWRVAASELTEAGKITVID